MEMAAASGAETTLRSREEEEVKVSEVAAAASSVMMSTTVFQAGKLGVDVMTADHNTSPTPPVPILIAAPKDAGTYPVVVFLHGFCMQNHLYEQVLRHMASFGFIMVAPQFHISMLPVGDSADIAAAAKVRGWLPGGLPSVLPTGVEADLSKLALAGHSRGGHTAFSLLLGHGGEEAKTGFSALIGLDPVAGTGRSSQISPKILTYEPASFDIAVPVLVIGTGLGEQKKNVLLPACAPKHVNHADFYNECRPPCYHLVTRDYGHLDMLDDDTPRMMTCMCKEGKSCRDAMRRAVAGIMVAFLKAVLEEQDADLQAILHHPGLAPTTLHPVHHRLP